MREVLEKWTEKTHNIWSFYLEQFLHFFIFTFTAFELYLTLFIYLYYILYVIQIELKGEKGIKSKLNCELLKIQDM